MFTLDEPIIEDIIFAMENQNTEYMIHGETGEIVLMDDDALDSSLDELDDNTDLLSLPEWISDDGFRLMTDFTAGVADPIARTELTAALGRGRGVFKAFKAAIAAWPDLERRWFDHKRAAMARRVREWYDDAREARGLARLGPEPDETGDILADDFVFLTGGQELWQRCVPLFRQGLDEALSSFPEAVVEYTYTVIEKEVSAEKASSSVGGLLVMAVEAPGGAIAGVAVARTVFVAESSFGKLVYLYVAPEHRRMGMASRLVEVTVEKLFKAGVPRCIVDLPFMPEGFGTTLAHSGYEAFGVRYVRTAD